MGDFIFPLQFKRQFDAPLDMDLVFTTTQSRNNYLTQPRRYAGQIVTDLEDGKIYRLNAARDAWFDISLQGATRYLALTGGQVFGNVTIHGDLSSSGTQTFANTQFTTTSALSVRNFGSSTALLVRQDGTGDIASFYDDNSGVEVLHVGGDTSINNFVGIRTGTPNKELTVNGELSARSNIYTGGEVYSLSGSSNDWNSVFSTVRQTSAGWVFANDLQVSLGGGRTFGRYANGTTIPAQGKTPVQVIQMAVVEPITPTASITPVTSQIAFNQTAVSNALNFSHTILSLGAQIDPSSGRIEFRRNNAGSWSLLSATVVPTGQFTHAFTDTEFNTQSMNYRYIVTDTAGASVTATNNVTIAGYSAPTATLTLSGNVTYSGSPESNTSRERGNVNSVISGTITRNAQMTNVPLSSYQLQYQVNGTGSWVNVGSQVQATSPSTISIASTFHAPPETTASSLVYRVQVLDAYTNSISTPSTIGNTTINFNYFIFYGPVASAPVNSAGVRALPTRAFTNVLSTPFILNTGTTLNIFTVALPTAVAAHDVITQVLDLDALNANITSNYINNPFTVNDPSGNGSTYNVYTLTNAVPYTDVPTGHRHQITRA